MGRPMNKCHMARGTLRISTPVDNVFRGEALCGTLPKNWQGNPQFPLVTETYHLVSCKRCLGILARAMDAFVEDTA